MLLDTEKSMAQKHVWHRSRLCAGMFEHLAAKYPEGLACKGMGVDWGRMFREPLTGNRLGGGCACRAGLRGGGGG